MAIYRSTDLKEKDPSVVEEVKTFDELMSASKETPEQEVLEQDLFKIDQRQTTVKIDKPLSTVNLDKLPDPKKHQIISFIKSGIRILACIIGSLGYWEWGFFGLGIAEVVGIIEELV